MIQRLFSRVTVLRRRLRAIFHRSDPLEAASAERRARWNAVIAEHKQGQQPRAAPDAKTK